ncbi:MAG: RluA family pseudouridine synthase [Clostridiales Family XIII bacterium]|jgi:23S rRNA pseudouridine955/2504/2580 synthase|nr:RluA family pseudouridine synthase [Clostridiales Family XIII bacterium]
MKTFTITSNESGQRLDRFLKKYLRAAPLSLIYRVIRKDVKINGSRKAVDYMLEEGDELVLHIDDARADGLARRGSGAGARPRPRIRFKVCYEDENVIAVAKPYGLLTHGDEREKKDTLVNQVVGYLANKGDYDPASERVFTPSSVNRLDRNTTGIVVFGKNPQAVRDFSRMIASEGDVRKYYLTLVLGRIDKELTLDGGILKDEGSNRVVVSDEGRPSKTIVRPVETFLVRQGAGRKRTQGDGSFVSPWTQGDGSFGTQGDGSFVSPRAVAEQKQSPAGQKGAGQKETMSYTLAEVWLVTGRPHQIRAHLAAAGHPVVGDPKYGDRRVNARFAARYGLESQFLHAHRLVVEEGRGSLEYLAGTVIDSPLPRRLADVTDMLRSG